MFSPLQHLTQCGLSSMSQRGLALRPHFGGGTPRPAVPELRVRQADQFPPVTKLDDRMRRVERHHAPPAQARDFHAQELVEKAAHICVCSAFGHGAEATRRPCQAQSGRRSARSRAGL
jgi:hypothetical protein